MVKVGDIPLSRENREMTIMIYQDHFYTVTGGTSYAIQSVLIGLIAVVFIIAIMAKLKRGIATRIAISAVAAVVAVVGIVASMNVSYRAVDENVVIKNIEKKYDVSDVSIRSVRTASLVSLTVKDSVKAQYYEIAFDNETSEPFLIRKPGSTIPDPSTFERRS